MSVFVAPRRTWTFNNAGEITSPNIWNASIGDAPRFAIDFTEPMPADVCISSITSVTVADVVGATEPTIGTPAKSYDAKKCEFDVTCTSATAATYTITATIVTTDSQTLVRKGRLVVE